MIFCPQNKSNFSLHFVTISALDIPEISFNYGHFLNIFKYHIIVLLEYQIVLISRSKTNFEVKSQRNFDCV